MFVTLGYHGCDLTTAQHVLSGYDFVDSTNSYDWLGTGVYFWENDPVRALEWAQKASKTPPCVVGAAIDLGVCLDLTVQDGLRAVHAAHASYVSFQALAGVPLPRNTDPHGAKEGDKILRRLDRAVIEHLYFLRSKTGTLAFETVRALFPEGEELYPNAGFRKGTHVQLCVRDHTRILGVFRLPGWQRNLLGLPPSYTADGPRRNTAQEH